MRDGWLGVMIGLALLVGCPAGDDDAGDDDATDDDAGDDDAGDDDTGDDDAGDDDTVPCTSDYDVPPANLPGWSPILSQDGAMTLTYDKAHSHDDGYGPLGFCPAAATPGQRYLKLVSARFETDQNPPAARCLVDYTLFDATLDQYGCCHSAGNHHIYVEVRDEAGVRLVAGFDLFHGPDTEYVPDQDKPPEEFPMNTPMWGGGRYGVRAVYDHPTDGLLPSDAVTNMRIPINHHVDYLLTFQVAVQ